MGSVDDDDPNPISEIDLIPVQDFDVSEIDPMPVRDFDEPGDAGVGEEVRDSDECSGKVIGGRDFGRDLGFGVRSEEKRIKFRIVGHEQDVVLHLRVEIEIGIVESCKS